ncbi:MAG: PhoH family protein [Thermodesulfobacteriota bacterium]
MSPRKKKKLYVLDTNVILHDSSSVFRFEEHDIAIPITVLEELDQFKKGNESLNFHARQFTRLLDELSGDKLFNGGVPVSPGLGRISVKLEQDPHPDLARVFPDNKPDHRILNIAFRLAREDAGRQVILVSKDVNLRMKAISLGMVAEDYKNDLVKDLGSLYKGHRRIGDIPDTLIDKLFNGAGGFERRELEVSPEIQPNEFLVLRNGRRSVLGCNDAESGLIRRIDKETCYGVTPRNAEQTFALSALLNPEIELITITGKAGSGKTLLALAAALHNRRNYRQIFMARPVVPLSNKDLGYLPGDVQSKLDPYMQPLFDNLAVLQMHETNGKSKCISEMLNEEKLVITPLAYIRGRSLVKIFFIVDEAQNLTPHEIKTIITRAGEGTKIIFTGDIFQIDHPYLNSHSNGLSYLIAKMQGQPLYAHINLEKGERSRLADLASTLL